MADSRIPGLPTPSGGVLTSAHRFVVDDGTAPSAVQATPDQVGAAVCTFANVSPVAGLWESATGSSLTLLAALRDLTARVVALEAGGGGGGGGSGALLLEDGTTLLLEDGTTLLTEA